MNRRLPAAILAAAALLAAAGCSQGTATCGALLVTDAWVREAPPNAGAAAGYLALFNSGSGTVTVTGATSPDFGKVMMHRTEEADGQMRMRHLERLAIDAGGKHVFRPGGDHLMLMEPQARVAEGDEVRLKLHCGDTETRLFTAPVRRAAPPG